MKYFFSSLDITGNDSYYSVITVKDIKFFSSLDSIDFEWFEETFDVFNPNTWKLNTLFSQSTDRNDRINSKQVFINQINIKPLFLGTESEMKTKKFCNKTPNSGIRAEKSVIFKNC